MRSSWSRTLTHFSHILRHSRWTPTVMLQRAPAPFAGRRVTAPPALALQHPRPAVRAHRAVRARHVSANAVGGQREDPELPAPAPPDERDPPRVPAGSPDNLKGLQMRLAAAEQNLRVRRGLQLACAADRRRSATCQACACRSDAVACHHSPSLLILHDERARRQALQPYLWLHRVAACWGGPATHSSCAARCCRRRMTTAGGGVQDAWQASTRAAQH